MNPPLGLRALTLAVTGFLLPSITGAGLFFSSAVHAAEASRTYDIPAGAMSEVLNRFGHEANLMLSYPAEQVAGLRSPGLRGNYSVDAGLAMLLSGSGLQAVRLSNGSYTLQSAGQDGLTLPASTISGSAETVSGPTRGIVATRSAVGTKTNTAINEVPQSISVITRDEMDKRGVKDFNAAVAYTPGIRAVDYAGGQGAPDIYMRGFRSFNLFGIYKDGLRSGFNQYDTDFETYGLERLDVIKGPASVLYGQMAPGGMVNLTSKRPTDEPIREIQVQGGSHDHKQGAIDIGDRLDDEGRLTYRLVALKRDSGTQVDHSPDDRTYVAPALTWKPDDDTRFTVLASYLKTRKGGAEQSFPVNGTLTGTAYGHVPSSTYLGDPDVSKYEVENTSLGYIFERQLSDDWTFTQNARYTKANVDYISNGARNGGQLGSDGRTYTFGYQKRPKKTDTFLLDNNLGGQFETGAIGHDVLFGLDYGHYSGRESRRGVTSNQTVDIFDPIYNASPTWSSALQTDGKSVVSQKGVYFQDILSLDNWRLTLGGRQDWVEGRDYSYLYDTRSVQKDDKFTGRVGLAYLFDNGITPYASYSTSFQPTSGVAQDGSYFKPTEGEQYELGIKYEPPGYNSFITLSVYDLTQKNVTTTDPTNPSYQVQTGEQRSRGVELEGKAELTRGLDLIASYAYTDAEVTKANPVGTGANAYSLEGNVPISVAKDTASLWLDYTVQGGPLEGLGMGIGQRYVGSSYNAKNTVKVPHYTLTDASVRYDLGHLTPDLKGVSVDLSASNLFDKRYFTPGFYESSVFYGTRRTVVGSLTYRW
ncbi:TonB-dependent siderophore receptor [Pseudomonas aeruginosa]|uniref:TonB-dependent siderophore receptor n=3 Tax=Pseudomonas aeruginosa TaxID=287 RepID=UPI00053D012B|nr:TonB-dependent siderophore receptor [Pseudomonas aeruginosa]ALZ10882.1 TonB-dependent receptor [Pseudomonas aeruginosa]KSL00345.1 TonB-dependent siderophore receptor [Pseudomonas aeruginosa]MBF1859771.1 TonB-dependent siderophore receptor [Pseudomonas aeruginosa]MBI8646345.1 TonB-dependent siderophore receptor [Pseudomonas aeruginosa]MBV6000788.1 TonB-dependent siderophore receptor [Pseudomonas aeruginosa]